MKFSRVMMMNRIKVSAVACCMAVIIASAPASSALRPASDETEVRAVVQNIFEQLRNGQYQELYDSLPSSSRSKITRERFANALQRSTGTYRLDRLEVGAVRVSGNIAAVDTVMYGSIQRPIAAEGKIVAQQYLVREEGRWRVATGDRATIRRFLASNPKFARNFQIKQPRVFVKRDGAWVDLTETLRQAKRAN
ncbi:MAG: hypothetical protein QOJ64_4226 [Acidobacteriota bacterium]|nr:hypothetical protein [Acidobacteriota bacterium]